MLPRRGLLDSQKRCNIWGIRRLKKNDPSLSEIQIEWCVLFICSFVINLAILLHLGTLIHTFVILSHAVEWLDAE